MKTLVIGTASSGKSEYAEKIVCENSGAKYYIATMQVYDDEARKRVEKHRLMRKDKGFETIECPTNLENVVFPQKGTVLLECMSNLLANEMFQEEYNENCTDKIIQAVKKISSECENFVIVSNDIFFDGVNYDEMTKKYIENLSIINYKISQFFDEVVEVVLGIEIKHKGKRI